MDTLARKVGFVQFMRLVVKIERWPFPFSTKRGWYGWIMAALILSIANRKAALHRFRPRPGDALQGCTRQELLPRLSTVALK